MTFMNSFNLIYYSFSPKVAEYIREKSWLQQRLSWIIPMFEILLLAERLLYYYQPWSGEIGTLFA
jgi:hypothetical protein